MTYDNHIPGWTRFVQGLFVLFVLAGLASFVGYLLYDFNRWDNNRSLNGKLTPELGDQQVETQTATNLVSEKSENSIERVGGDWFLVTNVGQRLSEYTDLIKNIEPLAQAEKIKNSVQEISHAEKNEVNISYANGNKTTELRREKLSLLGPNLRSADITSSETVEQTLQKEILRAQDEIKAKEAKLQVKAVDKNEGDKLAHKSKVVPDVSLSNKPENEILKKQPLRLPFKIMAVDMRQQEPVLGIYSNGQYEYLRRGQSERGWKLVAVREREVIFKYDNEIHKENID